MASVAPLTPTAARLLDQIAQSEGRLLDRQIGRHHSLYLLKWESDDSLIEELGTYCYQVEDLAEIRRLAVLEAVGELAKARQREKALTEQLAALRSELRDARPPQMRRAA